MLLYFQGNKHRRRTRDTAGSTARCAAILSNYVSLPVHLVWVFPLGCGCSKHCDWRFYRRIDLLVRSARS
jgi:hypothetical protein